MAANTHGLTIGDRVELTYIDGPGAGAGFRGWVVSLTEPGKHQMKVQWDANPTAFTCFDLSQWRHFMRRLSILDAMVEVMTDAGGPDEQEHSWPGW